MTELINTNDGFKKVFNVKERWPKYILGEGVDWISDNLRNRGCWELKQIQDCIDRIPENSLFIDVGANLGVWTCTILCHRYDIVSHCFEPQKEIYYQLCGNVFLNGLSDRVICHNLALSNSENDNTILKFENNRGAGSFSDHLGKGGIIGHEVVKCVMLDSFDLQNVGCIKIDVEGHELEVLTGARETILKNKPLIYFEAWPHASYQKQKDSLFEYLFSLGYTTIVCLDAKEGDFLAMF